MISATILRIARKCYCTGRYRGTSLLCRQIEHMNGDGGLQVSAKWGGIVHDYMMYS